MVEVRGSNAGVSMSHDLSSFWGGKSFVARLVVGVSVICAVLLLPGCAIKPAADRGAKELTSKPEALSEFMSRAQAAEAAEGGRERARLIYRDAAKAYPTDKRPWLRLAQSYFDSGDYGNAVLAAQEVVQRDPADNTAQGLLAVSGLRISTAALSALRNHDNLTTSTRTEAEDMARNLRAVLGETVLVPTPADTAEVTHQPKPQPRKRPRARVAPSVTAPAAAPAAPAPTTAPSNPFGALK